MVGAESAALSASRMSNGGRAQAPLLVSYAPEMERVNGVAPLSRLWHSRILLLNHTREIDVHSRTFTNNLTLRTRPLCILSYGDKMVRASGNAPDPGTDLVRCGV